MPEKTPLDRLNIQIEHAGKNRSYCVFSLEEAIAIRDEIRISADGWRSCIDHIIKPESKCPVCKLEELGEL